MDPNLHQKQGINHIMRVLSYAQFVKEDGKATVHLTSEDWHVVADTLFHMETPKEMLPDVLSDFQLTSSNQIIELTTAELVVNVEMI